VSLGRAGRRALLAVALGLPALVLVGGVVLLKLAQVSYQEMRASQGANERAVVGELRALLAARHGGASPAPIAELGSGYRRRLHAGGAGGFAYVAVPLERHVTGRSSFCADGSGLVRFSVEGEEPSLADGSCPRTWLILSETAPGPAWP
jgi:hypothetical protein